MNATEAASGAGGVSRRRFVLAVPAALAGLAWASKPGRAGTREVPWLDEVQTPPSRLPPEAPDLPPLLVGRGGAPSAPGFSGSPNVRGSGGTGCGSWAPCRPTGRRWRWRSFRRKSWTGAWCGNWFGTTPRPVFGWKATCWDRRRGRERNRRAGVVVLHPTSSLTIDLVAGVNGPEEQQVGLKLARRGLVVFCPRCFLWQDAGNFLEAMARFKQRHPETLCMHKMLWDAMRGVDLLESLPQVDASRIGAVGHSLGAIESLYLAAFDERVRVTVASEAGLDFSFTNWHDPWFLGPAIRSPDFKLNHHQLLALTAPRAFLVLAGESGRHAADGDRSWPFIEAALKVYRLYGSPARLGIYNHGKGHTLPPQAFQRMAEWLETYLKVRS